MSRKLNRVELYGLSMRQQAVNQATQALAQAQDELRKDMAALRIEDGSQITEDGTVIKPEPKIQPVPITPREVAQ